MGTDSLGRDIASQLLVQAELAGGLDISVAASAPAGPPRASAKAKH